jgi:replication-associated recombination protein RarA
MGKIVNTEIKYRPYALKDYVFPNDEVRDVAMSYASGNQSRPLLLYGPFGTGKSLLAELIPKAIEANNSPNISRLMSFNLNSSVEICDKYESNKNYDLIFNQQKYNYYIVEEVNFLVKGADAFRIVMDKYKGIDLTILTSNEIHKVDGGIKSRCKCLYVPPCAPKMFLPRALQIVNSEGYDIDAQALLNMLESVYKLTSDNRRYYEKIDELLQTA